VRARSGEDLGAMTVAAFLAVLRKDEEKKGRML
jgi:hypothetical protein